MAAPFPAAAQSSIVCTSCGPFARCFILADAANRAASHFGCRVLCSSEDSPDACLQAAHSTASKWSNDNVSSDAQDWTFGPVVGQTNTNDPMWNCLTWVWT